MLQISVLSGLPAMRKIKPARLATGLIQRPDSTTLPASQGS
jgi:hypothetical protein